MYQSAITTANNGFKSYRSGAQLAIAEERRQMVVGPISRWSDRMSLASIAAAMNVPVVIATYRGENNVQTVATHGLGLMNNLARFAAVCDSLCRDRVVVIPDTRTNPVIATLARHWPSDDVCFLVGVPLRDARGRRVGSLCVMNKSYAVAKSGISFRMLSDIGKAFAESGSLQAVTPAT